MPFKLRLLTDRLFVLGLAVLLVNDFYLKYAVPGVVTGKLSDLAGLFIFPFFWSVFFEKHRVHVYVLTCAAFIFWKLPLSTEFITAFNRLLGAEVHRVVDPTDLGALLVVPLSLWYFNVKRLNYTGEHRSHQRLVSYTILATSLFAFVATSVPFYSVYMNMPIGEKLVCRVGKQEIFKGNMMSPSSERSGSLEQNLVDSTFMVSYLTGESSTNAYVIVKIYPLDSATTIFEIDSLKGYWVPGNLFTGKIRARRKLEEKTRDEVISNFRKQVIDPVERNTGSTIYFTNLERDEREGRREPGSPR